MATRYRITCDACPFDRVYASRAKADYAFERHSCERWQRRAELAARGQARKESIDRTPKPCLHKEADHRHGTYACYVLDRCRCEPCANANSTYKAERVRQQAYGRWNGLVDADPARQHVRDLMAQGMGLKRIVAVSGVAQGVLWKLMYGKPKADGSRTPSRRITPGVEQRILATQLDLAGGAIVDSTGAVRRIQALVALGWSLSKIAGRLGILRSNFTALAHGRTSITVAHDKAVRALYDEWSMQIPPQDEWRGKIAASRSRNYAKANGWLPPLAWDDELIDDPTVAPLTGTPDDDDYLDEAAIVRRMHGEKSIKLTAAEQVELVLRMVSDGVSKKDIQQRTGLNPHRILRPQKQAVPAFLGEVG